MDKKRDKIERKILDSQERAFWDVHRPVVSKHMELLLIVRISKDKHGNPCKVVIWEQERGASVLFWEDRSGGGMWSIHIFFHSSITVMPRFSAVFWIWRYGVVGFFKSEKCI